MKDKLAADPLTYLIAFSLLGAVSMVSGVAVLAGGGWALVCAGLFLLAAAGYITRGMTPNG